MNDEDTRQDWHDQRGVVWAAGVAAVVLIVLLVWAVMRMASGSPVLPDSEPSVPPEVTSEFTRAPMTTSTSTSYAPPSAQTTELDPSALPGTTADEPTPQEPATTTATSPWTPTNPYATTTVPNGGAV